MHAVTKLRQPDAGSALRNEEHDFGLTVSLDASGATVVRALGLTPVALRGLAQAAKATADGLSSST